MFTFTDFLWFLIATPFQMVLWCFVVAFLCWIVGLPIDFKVGDEKRKYRWFRRVK